MSYFRNIFIIPLILRISAVLLLINSNAIFFFYPKIALGSQDLVMRAFQAKNYSQIKLEHNQYFNLTYFKTKNPKLLIIDTPDKHLSNTFKKIITQTTLYHPYIQKIQIQRNSYGTTRLMFYLKYKTKLKIFKLSPLKKYKHRFLLAFYLVNQFTPTSIFIKKNKFHISTQKSLLLKPVVLKTQRILTIAIDPGHGGEDSGAIGKHGYREKDIVLSIARRLKRKIDTQKNMRAMLTRNGDFFVPLKTRVQKARKAKADLFISIHTDAFTKPTAKGSSVFALSKKSAKIVAIQWFNEEKKVKKLSNNKNIRLQKTQIKKSVLLSLSTTKQIQNSLKAGRAVLDEISNINPLHRNKVERAEFSVLKTFDIPSILIETAFISNPYEENRLTNHHYQNSMANAILVGIKKYFF